MITHLEISLEKYAFSHYEDYNLQRFGYDELLRYIVKRLSIPESARCEYHLKLHERVSEGGSVLSLNYDLTYDQVLYEKERKKGGFSLLTRSRELIGDQMGRFWPTETSWRDVVGQTFYIKLHGSIGWVQCPNAACINHQNIEMCCSTIAPTSRIREEDPCTTCGSPLKTVIVMPTMKKSFEKYPKMGLLWEIAFRKLKEAETLIIMGTSLPPSDYYLNWLLKETSVGKRSLRLIAVNGDKAAALRAKTIVGVGKAIWCPDFREWANGVDKHKEI